MTTQYSLTLRVLHWTTAGLVALQVILAIANIVLYEPRPVLAEALVQTHISFGAVVFLLSLARVGARFASPAPVKSPTPALNAAAQAVHVFLYLCLFALPITGYLKLAALGFTITLFGVVPLPALPLNVPLAQSANGLHDAVALVLGGLLALHVAAALFHRRLDGRSVLPHMALGLSGR